MAKRNRVNITLSDTEYKNLLVASELLGVKPTQFAYQALNKGIPVVIHEAQKLNSTFNFFKRAKDYEQVDIEDDF